MHSLHTAYFDYQKSNVRKYGFVDYGIFKKTFGTTKTQKKFDYGYPAMNHTKK